MGSPGQFQKAPHIEDLMPQVRSHPQQSRATEATGVELYIVTDLALDTPQPLLHMGLVYVEGVTHDYIRHGTTTLFAALDVATGEVITKCKPRHRNQEFLGFLRQIYKSVPAPLDIHLAVDNYCTQKHPLDRRSSAQR